MLQYNYFITGESQADFQDVLMDREFDTTSTRNRGDSKIGFYERVASSMTLLIPSVPIHTPSSQAHSRLHTPNTRLTPLSNGFPSLPPHPSSNSSPLPSSTQPSPLKLPSI